MTTPGSGSGRTTRTFERGLRVMETLAEQGGDSGLGVSDVAEQAGLDKATAVRLLQTLCVLGYAYQDGDTRRYKLTGKILALGTTYRRGLDLPQRAGPAMAELRARTEETVHLGVRELDRIVYIAKLETQLPVQIGSAIGQSMPLHTTALGKAILAALPEHTREALLASLELGPPRTERSITGLAALRHELAKTAARGYAIDDRENEDAITCVGAAIVDSVGEVLGALSVSGPTYRMEGRVDELGLLCRDAADTVAKGL